MTSPLDPAVFRRDPLAESLNDALAGVLDEARQLHSNGDETFVSCALCCGWEGDHSPACPVRAISYWLDTQRVIPVTPEETHGTKEPR